jgi:hypothetical protein
MERIELPNGWYWGIEPLMNNEILSDGQRLATLRKPDLSYGLCCTWVTNAREMSAAMNAPTPTEAKLREALEHIGSYARAQFSMQAEPLEIWRDIVITCDNSIATTTTEGK